MEIRQPKFNKVMLSGRVANDIELRYTAKGTAVVKFAIAVDNNFKDSAGNWQNNAYFFDVTAWEKWAEAVNNNAHKGSPIMVEGKLTANTYEKDGQKHKSVEVVAEYIQFLEMKPKNDAPVESEPYQPQAQNRTNDDVPF